MIKQKKKICKSCGNERYIFSKGRCKQCTVIEQRVKLNNNSKNKKDQSLENFFNALIEKCAYSEEDGTPIPNPNKSNICHIFPKRKYKSVSTDFDNCIFLTFDQHTQFDNYLDKLDFANLEKNFPNAWDKVITRVKKLLPKITETGRLKTQFEEYVTKES